MNAIPLGSRVMRSPRVVDTTSLVVVVASLVVGAAAPLHEAATTDSTVAATATRRWSLTGTTLRLPAESLRGGRRVADSPGDGDRSHLFRQRARRVFRSGLGVGSLGAVRACASLLPARVGAAVECHGPTPSRDRRRRTHRPADGPAPDGGARPRARQRPPL